MIIAYFNSRPHKGDDKVCFRECAAHLAFQLTSPQGGRPAGEHHYQRGQKDFNSRPHKGDDQGKFFWLPSPVYFNSRPHKGDDYINVWGWFKYSIFQLTSPQGGRQIQPPKQRLQHKFQLTSPQGGRHISTKHLMLLYLFQLTSPQGGRQNIVYR